MTTSFAAKRLYQKTPSMIIATTPLPKSPRRVCVRFPFLGTPSSQKTRELRHLLQVLIGYRKMFPDMLKGSWMPTMDAFAHVHCVQLQFSCAPKL